MSSAGTGAPGLGRWNWRRLVRPRLSRDTAGNGASGVSHGDGLQDDRLQGAGLQGVRAGKGWPSGVALARAAGMTG